MAEKRRELDVWILQTNTVYRKVPYTVITDWIQEGRLLAEDRVRAAGTEKWHQLGKVPALAAFLPRAEPFRAEDKAEALEPVEVGVQWHTGRRGDDDDDVDMIPLIDISLVLLIFFMMTATVATGLLSPIQTPAAKNQLEVISEDMYWVGIDGKGPEGQVERGGDGWPVPWYSLGLGDNHLVKPTTDAAAVTAELGRQLAAADGDVRVRLRADKGLMVEVVRAMIERLQREEARLNGTRGASPGRLKLFFLGEVSEPQSP
jgi:biopolymer transport protein ExbD